MRTIWKYPIKTQDMNRIEMPIGAEILTVKLQNGAPMLWVLVHDDNDKEVRFIEVIGTGNPINQGPRKYIGTYMERNDIFVWHVFEYLGL